MHDHTYLFSGLRNAPRQLKKDMSAIVDAFMPMKPGEWNLHQIVFHIRDVNAEVYLPRLKRIVEGWNPAFENFDGEQWMTTHYDAGENLDDMVNELTLQCEEIADWLESLPETDWERAGTHPSPGTHTLEWWADLTLKHIEEHLAQVREE